MFQIHKNFNHQIFSHEVHCLDYLQETQDLWSVFQAVRFGDSPLSAIEWHGRRTPLGRAAVAADCFVQEQEILNKISSSASFLPSFFNCALFLLSTAYDSYQSWCSSAPPSSPRLCSFLAQKEQRRGTSDDPIARAWACDGFHPPFLVQLIQRDDGTLIGSGTVISDDQILTSAEYFEDFTTDDYSFLSVYAEAELYSDADPLSHQTEIEHQVTRVIRHKKFKNCRRRSCLQKNNPLCPPTNFMTCYDLAIVNIHPPFDPSLVWAVHLPDADLEKRMRLSSSNFSGGRDAMFFNLEDTRDDLAFLGRGYLYDMNYDYAGFSDEGLAYEGDARFLFGFSFFSDSERFSSICGVAKICSLCLDGEGNPVLCFRYEDSGGPVIYNDDGVPRYVGVIGQSYSFNAERSSFSSSRVHWSHSTPVFPFKKWILQHMGKKKSTLRLYPPSKVAMTGHHSPIFNSSDPFRCLSGKKPIFFLNSIRRNRYRFLKNLFFQSFFVILSFVGVLFICRCLFQRTSLPSMQEIEVRRPSRRRRRRQRVFEELND